MNIDFSQFQSDDYLKEYHFGEWQKFSPEQIEKASPNAIVERLRDKWNFRPPGGETYAELEVRGRTFLETAPSGSVIVVIAHEMINRVLQKLLLELGVPETLSLRQPNDVLIVIDPHRQKEVLHKKKMERTYRTSCGKRLE
jgi:probable phosphoglycerate mutase